jgi:hypothetical protein
MWSWISVPLILKMGKVESGDERTHKVQTRKVIAIVDRKMSVEHKSSPRVFIDSEIGKRKKKLTKVLKCGITKGDCLWS